MNRKILIAASNQEMYGLLDFLASLGAVILDSEAHPLTVDPLGFHHLPRTMYASLPQSKPLQPVGPIFEGDDPGPLDAVAAQVIVLRTTRFGVGSDGKPVCYPGSVEAAEDAFRPAPPWLRDAFDQLRAHMQQVIAYRLDERDESRFVYVFPDAASFVREGRVAFEDETRSS